MLTPVVCVAGLIRLTFCVPSGKLSVSIKSSGILNVSSMVLFKQAAACSGEPFNVMTCTGSSVL